jgi:hypothetical protein
MRATKYMIAIEAGNNGVGEPWSTVALDAYIRMLAVLCQVVRVQRQP